MSAYYGCAFVVVLGVLFGLSLARQTYEESMPIGGSPTPTEYLVRRPPFVLGQFVFAVFCLGIYAFLLAFHQLLPQLANFLPTAGKEAVSPFIEAVTKRDTPLLVTVVALTVGFLTIIRKQFPGNVVFAFRSFVYSAIAVPMACKHAAEQLLEGLTVPEEIRRLLSDEPRLHISYADFEEDRNDDRRRWAELAYLNWWVKEQKDKNALIYVVLERHFNDDKLQNRFVALRELTRLSKEGEEDQSIRDAMVELLNDLRSEYARYVACMLISASDSRLDFYERCKSMEIDPGPDIVYNPLMYCGLYIIAMAAAIAIGPYLMEVAYDLSEGAGWSAFGPQSLDYVRSWLLLGFAYWFSPIFAVLLVRYIAWKISHVRSHVSLVIYAWILLGVFLVSLGCGTAASMFVRQLDFFNLTDITAALMRGAPWSINPALTALYINYFMDLQADPAKDDIVQTRETFLPRLSVAIAFALGTMAIAMLIVAHQQLSDGLWSQPKTQVVVVGTTGIIVLCLCLVAQFGLRKELLPVEDEPAASIVPVDAVRG